MLLELSIFRNCFIEVACRDSIFRELHFDTESGTNDFLYIPFLYAHTDNVELVEQHYM
jgi:hypothetical protein